jgi:hypothetical protein
MAETPRKTVFSGILMPRRTSSRAGTVLAMGWVSTMKRLANQPTTRRSNTMKTLTIKDLARTEHLGADAMAAVRGGYNMGSQFCAPSSFCYCPMPSSYSPSSDSSVHATQGLSQLQNVVNATANGSAFLDGVHVTNKTSQFGQNNISVGHGLAVA